MTRGLDSLGGAGAWCGGEIEYRGMEIPFILSMTSFALMIVSQIFMTT